ncbi:unnamed protein product [Psylliodes chrysocephalus]|uniref:Enoyl-CoA hydratase n=1 Tax=Psylliodes chrysocephalus TaxID=3402493 RepID=A0A9P0D2G0_9CUCU|nr:unnamed protein product [Psylliodes chrysocephala]
MPVILESIRDGLKTIKINRPERKNALNSTAYRELTKILNKDATNDKIVVTILTGIGDYFSSGNDLAPVMSEEIEVSLDCIENMVKTIINYPKLLVCVVNGPAIGIGATLVTLCDVVYASDKAIFDLPFMKLGLVAEGCSSYNYPLILGRSVASEMIFFGRKLTAQEALKLGLVSRVIPHIELPSFVDSLHQYGKLPVENVKRNKAVIMDNFRDVFLQINKREFKYIKEAVYSEDFAEAIAIFLSKKSKL